MYKITSFKGRKVGLQVIFISLVDSQYLKMFISYQLIIVTTSKGI